jgi:hypothetical protein
VRRDEAEFHRPRASPERLVLVVEDPLEHVPRAAEVDVRDLGLRLEDGAHELRQVGVDLDDLLELVEDEGRAPAAFGGELAREREEPLEGRVDVLGTGARGTKSRARPPAGRPSRRARRKAGENAQRVLRLEEHRRELVVDRLGELLGELLPRGRGHQVELGDEHASAAQLLDGAQHERRLPVAPRGEDDDVLSVQDVGLELAQPAVGEGLIEGERAEAEGVRPSVTQNCVTQIPVA